MHTALVINNIFPTRSSVIKQTFRKASVVRGQLYFLVRLLIWGNIFLITFIRYRSLKKSLFYLKKLKALRQLYRDGKTLQKYQRQGLKIFVNYNTPAWPSVAFNRYIHHLLNRTDQTKTSLNTLVFAVTKKCGFQCEHCCEWKNLNGPEQLSLPDLEKIITRFQSVGIAQVQISGGEPLNRLKDIFPLIESFHHKSDFWLYTSGYTVTHEKARALKQRGLRGITISMDHFIAEEHDRFRGVPGSFSRAAKAIEHARNNKLLVCLSLCATRQFISWTNLMSYALMARKMGVHFIQVLEPKAVGRYEEKNVTLTSIQIKMLEDFYTLINYDPRHSHYPTISYHGFYSRRMGCSGGGNDYVYVNTNGFVQACPFCQRELFHALDGNLQNQLKKIRTKGCSVINLKTIV